MEGNTSGSGIHGTAKAKQFCVLITACVEDHTSRVLLFPPPALKGGGKKNKSVLFFSVHVCVSERVHCYTEKPDSVTEAKSDF